MNNIQDKMNTVVNRTMKNTNNRNQNDILPPVLNGKDTSKIRENKQINSVNEKIFLSRNSVLTDLFEIPHFKTIYRVFLSMLIIFFINSIAAEIFSSGNILNEFRFIIIGFGSLHIVTATWLCMQCVAMLFYFIYNQWAKCRNIFVKKPNHLSLYDKIWLMLYTIFQILYMTIPLLIVIKLNLPPASGFIITMETVRFMMKFHAFIRVVSPRYMNDTESAVVFPPFYSYFYYLFIPTLIYRDSYPRTQKTNWNQVMIYFAEVATCIIFINFIFGKYISVHWVNIGEEFQTLDMKKMIQLYYSSVFPSVIIMTCCFYMLLHCWMNAFAEICRFADRKFYTDWWNQKGYSSYYRTWNLIVQDWLYDYIYKDVTRLTKNRLFSAVTVFFISAIVHEIILAVTLGFFYPVLSLNFMIPGYLLTRLEKYMSHNAGNVLFWITWILGDGLIWTTYTMEYYARFNCPSTVENKILDIFIPRSWFC